MKKETGLEKSLHPDHASQPCAANRRDEDRRKNQKASLKYFLFNGRRERIRRAEDNQKAVFFDRYPPKLFAAIAAILMLSIFDALLTLILISKGSTELNPVMAYFLQHGLLPFIVAKYILTSFGVVILLIFKNVFLTRVKMYTHSLFPIVIFTFTAVIVWELILIITSI
ncbi:hypothetical protein D1AOALGA4SA_9675 [Olavius algarvensis Delta 1 endosymbiont]|nr:hypothetical protein D1AOALGA4SA_9675 [Olavius algarvensis Delta 1 endosymbiont]